jgi:hypothetical protein
MFAVGINYRGLTKIPVVPAGVKMNLDVYMNNFSKPMFEENIPTLYGGNLDKVACHHDNALAYQSAVTKDRLTSNQIECIPNQN